MASSVRVYDTLATSVVVSCEEQLERLMFALGGSSPRQDCVFAVGANGVIVFRNNDEVMSSRTKKNLPKSDAEAVSAARRFVQSLNQEASKRDLLGSALLPSNTRETLVSVVYDASGTRADHWYVCFRALLSPSAEAKPVPVFDAKLKMRIGDGGSIIELCSNWRPTRGHRDVDRYVLAAGGSDAGSLPEVVPKLLYLLPGEDSNVISPYYLAAATGLFVPACDDSEEIRVSVPSSDEEDTTATLFG